MSDVAPKALFEGMPYHSQFASPELVGSIVFGDMQARDDPRWAESGASSPEEYQRWAWNLCGMVCLKSVLEYTNTSGQEKSLMELAKACVDRGAYTIDSNTGEIRGLFYEPFVRYIRDEFGMNGRVAAPLSVEDMIGEIHEGNFVIASVHPTIRDLSPPPRKGGHLVLVTGYDRTDETTPKLIYHDPAGLYGESQEYASAPVDTFNNYFAGRGVVIFRPKEKP